MKRTRKSQARRGRGRQRVTFVHPKKRSPSPEPKLEDLEPYFTAAEMGAMFKKEFGMDMKTFRQGFVLQGIFLSRESALLIL